MEQSTFRCVTLSDFNLSNLDALLENDESDPTIQVVRTGLGQLHQNLLDPDANCWQDRPDAVLIWTRPEAAVPTFGQLKSFESVHIDDVLSEVDRFAELILPLGDRVGTVLVPTWTNPHVENGFGVLDMRGEIGIANTLMRMNLRLADRLEGGRGIFVLDAQPWIAQAGRKAYSPKLWAMAKIPFTNDVFRTAAAGIKAAARAVRGRARKLIIFDLDNTIWGGVVGDDGWERLRLGGHDAVGEAFADFQRALKSMTNRGILLGVVSKNSEEVVREAFSSHPEMVLTLDDLSGWRVNWDDKAANVASLVEELNLGLQSAVFIDDNPFERARVSEALPEVLVPEWPDDPALYRQELLSMSCFDSASLTSEDRRRSEMYRAERDRESLRHNVGSLDEWLETLEMVVGVEPLNEANRARVAQLLNKTNQMNLRTRRMSEAELIDWVQEPHRVVRALKVSDRFGDAGITGILSLEKRGDSVHVIDFVLSCRVMGRKVEEAMVAIAASEAKRLGARTLTAEYLATAKNKPCLKFWQRSGFRIDGQHVFSWPLDDPYPSPPHIRLVTAEEEVVR